MRALYDRTHAREHDRHATIIEDWRLFQDGTVGAYRVNRLGRDERDTTQLGPLTYEKGVLRGVHWEQNRNGIVYTYPGIHEARDAVSEHAFRDPSDDRNVRLAGEAPWLNAYVVEVNPPQGRHEWIFVDKRTGDVVRRERLDRRRRYSTTYDDYRLVDGVPEPSRIRTVDSLGNEREQILVSRTLDDTPDLRDVEMPANRRFVEFPDRSGPVRLPVRMVNGLAVVRVIVGRTGYDFLLDSGAAGIVVDPSLVEQQNLERYGQHIGSTVGAFPESTTIVPQISLGGLRMRNVVARVVAVPFRPDEHTRLGGLLGFDFFADSVVHVDLAHGLFEAYAPERFHPPADAASAPLALDDKTPVVHLRAGSTVARVVLDTGANRSLFETAYADHAEFGAERIGTVLHVRGMGGLASAEVARMPWLDFAGIGTRDATVDVSSADLGTEYVDGILGTDLLRNYDLWFDDRANAVYVRRTIPKKHALSP